MQSKNCEIDIFLCDDEPELVEDIAEFLRMEGYSCRSTSSPHEARNFIRSAQRPFVLLSDMRMPGITGLDLARTAAEGQGPARNFEVILFSAFSDMERAIEALKIGVLDFLMKPFDLDQLRLALQRALEQIEDRRRQSELGNGFSHQLSNALSKIREVASALEAAQVNTQAPLLQTQAYRSPVALARERDDWIIRGIKLHQSTRRLRDKTFPMCAYDDGAWEILLYVVEQSLLGRMAPVTSACHACAVPQTTAMRRIDELVGLGLFLKIPDSTDRRRVLLEASPECIERTKRFFDEMYRQLDSILLANRPAQIGTRGVQNSAVRVHSTAT